MTETTADRTAQNAELLRSGYEAFGAGDMTTIQRLFHPEIVWHAQRLGILGGDHRGIEEVMSFFGRSMDLTAGTFRVEVQEVLANDDGAAAVVRSSGRRGDAVLDSLQIQHFRVRDGRVVEVWQYVADSSAVEAFWS